MTSRAESGVFRTSSNPFSFFPISRAEKEEEKSLTIHNDFFFIFKLFIWESLENEKVRKASCRVEPISDQPFFFF